MSEFLSSYINHTLFLEKMYFVADFLSLYWFQTFTTLSFVIVLLYINHLERRIYFTEYCFEEHLKAHVELEEDLENTYDELKQMIEEIGKQIETRKFCKAIANLHFEKRKELIQCENLAVNGTDFCDIHDERDVYDVYVEGVEDDKEENQTTTEITSEDSSENGSEGSENSSEDGSEYEYESSDEEPQESF